MVASLYQMPNDPFEQLSSHRPLDYWGRNLLDHLITLLPEALADDGVAYVCAAIGDRRAQDDRNAGAGGIFLKGVVDFAFVGFSELLQEPSEQIERVEELSDAYHIKLGDRDVMVAYLIEITRAGGGRSSS